MASKYGIKLLSGYSVLGTQTAVYTVPTNLSRVIISSAFVVNRNTSPANLTIWIVPSSESIADRHKAFIDIQIATEETMVLDQIIGFPLNVGDVIYAQASLADSLALNLSATTFTPE